MRAAIAGARGYVGGRLVERLTANGVEVVALGRDGARLPRGERITPIAVDVGDESATADALAGCDAAYYLVHSMAGGADFAERDRRLAATFAAAAARAGVRRIVYLGGLGANDLSPHLASRHEVGRELAAGPVEVVELRAAVILGSGSISFEMLRYLTDRLPAMVCPRWIATRIQPIAEADLVDYLERSLDPTVAAGVYEVGGPDVTTYREMIAAYARVRGLRARRILDVPLLTPWLSAWWVDLVTPVDRRVSHTLIDSLGTEVVVHDGDRTARALGPARLGMEAAIAAALDDQVRRLPDMVFDLPTGTSEGVYAMHEHARIAPDDVDAVRDGLHQCGGDLGWYGVAWAWRLRILLGRLFGERLSLHRPPAVLEGAPVDWWTVARADGSQLVLDTREWFCGEAWLGYRIETTGDEPRIVQVGAMRSKGRRASSTGGWCGPSTSWCSR